MRKNAWWKKLLAAGLCTVMAAGLLAACGNTNQNGTEKKEEVENKEDTGSQEAEGNGTEDGTTKADGEEREIITLKVMGEVSSDCMSTDDAIGDVILEKFGIIMECTAVTDDKLKVMAAGGDLPDIVQLHEAPTLAKSLIDAGALYPLDDLLDSHGSTIREKLPDGLKWSKEVLGGGTTYAIPVAIEVTNADNPNKNGFVGFFTRWDIYKEIGCPEINGEDEFLDVLQQMMELHPETEDGRKVYALSAWSDWGLWPYKISYPFSHGYENLDNNQLFSHVTGEIEDMFTKEDGIFWDAIQFFNKAYRKGLLDPEAFTMKNSQYHDKVANGEVLVSANNWDVPDLNILGEDAGMYVLPGAFPYTSGVYPLESRLGYTTTNALCISSNCAYPERAMELLDFLNSDEGMRLVHTGIEGEDWEVVDGKPQLIGKRLENFVSGNTVHVDYADKASPQGIGKYDWMTSVQSQNPAADGYPYNLCQAQEYILLGVQPADEDFAKYYGGEEARYPGEAYIKLIEEGRMKMLETNLLTGKLMEPVSDESAKIFSKADEYFNANIAKIIMCETDEEYAKQKQNMIDDIMAMGYQSALDEIAELFERAKEIEQIFN